MRVDRWSWSGNKRWRRLAILPVIGIGIAMWVFSQQAATDSFSMEHTQEKVVALTFDDGPNKPYTQQILDILDEKKIKATFFVLGENVKPNLDLLQRMVSQGHEIENHGYSHDFRQYRLFDELKKSDTEIYDVIKMHTQYYRPPGGYITKFQRENIEKKGYEVILWSVDSQDWRRPGVKGIINNVIKNVYSGAIILFHDGGGLRIQTVEALKLLITDLSNQGYRFVTIRELKDLKNRENTVFID